MPFYPTTTQPAEEQWASWWTQVLPAAQEAVRLISLMNALFSANPEIAELAEETTPTAAVGAANMIPAQVMAIAELGQALGVFMATPLTGCHFTPAQILYRIWKAPVQPMPSDAPSVTTPEENGGGLL